MDQLYLGYPAGGDDREKQSFLWFHDHVHGHTGANVYKGMVGLMPIYDPKHRQRRRDRPQRPAPARRPHEQRRRHVRRRLRHPAGVLRLPLDDGVTPHKDAHNGSGETHPEWWGKTFFRHFPNHGFVGDIFTVNGTAYPVLEVKRRKYRLRFLDASISRIYEFKLMTRPAAQGGARPRLHGRRAAGPVPPARRPQCMKFVRDRQRGRPAAQADPPRLVRAVAGQAPRVRRRLHQYMDGSPTQEGDEIYLVNIMKMTTGRMWDAADPNYKVPVMKIVIGDDAPDNSLRPRHHDRQAGARRAGRA